MEWIIDSGASDHMCGEPTVVKNVNLPNELKINMPNGDTTNIVAFGNVDLKNGLHLKQVSVVPEFKHNLLSVSKLAKNEQCTVNFYGGYCIIQKKLTQNARGIEECRDGLYCFIDDNLDIAIQKLSEQVEKKTM